MKKPICKKCEELNQKYSVEQPLYGVTTLMSPIPSYWDENGVFHQAKDPNTTTFQYTCSNGHSWSETN